MEVTIMAGANDPFAEAVSVIANWEGKKYKRRALVSFESVEAALPPVVRTAFKRFCEFKKISADQFMYHQVSLSTPPKEASVTNAMCLWEGVSGRCGRTGGAE